MPTTAGEARTEVELVLHPLTCRADAGRGNTVVTDALVVASELVTNALVHTRGLTAFACRLSGDDVTISVSDASSTLPPARGKRPDRGVPGGWGWWMVQRLAHTVSVIRSPAGGKTIVASLTLRPCGPC